MGRYWARTSDPQFVETKQTFARVLPAVRLSPQISACFRTVRRVRSERTLSLPTLPTVFRSHHHSLACFGARLGAGRQQTQEPELLRASRRLRGTQRSESQRRASCCARCARRSLVSRPASRTPRSSASTRSSSSPVADAVDLRGDSRACRASTAASGSVAAGARRRRTSDADRADRSAGRRRRAVQRRPPALRRARSALRRDLRLPLRCRRRVRCARESKIDLA